MRSRITTLLAVPLVAFALLAATAGPAAAQTDTKTDGKTLIFHESRQLKFPASPGGNQTGEAAVTAESCVWDTYIYRVDATGNLSAETAVSCTAVMYQISVQAIRLLDGSPVIGTGRVSHRFGWQSNIVTTTPAPCIPGVNKSYGSVYVVNFAGLAASDFGESMMTITC